MLKKFDTLSRGFLFDFLIVLEPETLPFDVCRFCSSSSSSSARRRYICLSALLEKFFLRKKKNGGEIERGSGRMLSSCVCFQPPNFQSSAERVRDYSSRYVKFQSRVSIFPFFHRRETLSRERKRFYNGGKVQTPRGRGGSRWEGRRRRGSPQVVVRRAISASAAAPTIRAGSGGRRSVSSWRSSCASSWRRRPPPASGCPLPPTTRYLEFFA